MPPPSPTIGNKSRKFLQDWKKKLSGPDMEVTAGFLEGGKYPDGTSIPQVMSWQEYGTDRIPPRPFMRYTGKKYRESWRKYYEKEIRNGANPEDVLERLGAGMRGHIQKTMNEWREPPNATSVIKRKGFDKPLIDTGTAINSASHEVRPAKKKGKK